jgi:hypothetical protein
MTPASKDTFYDDRCQTEFGVSRCEFGDPAAAEAEGRALNVFSGSAVGGMGAGLRVCGEHKASYKLSALEPDA